MKRIAVFAALAAAIMVLPSAASAKTNCSYTSPVPGGPVGIQAGPGGLSGQAALAVGACVNLGDAGDGSVADQIGFYGGAIEAGVNATNGTVINPLDPLGPPLKPGIPGVYAVIDGDDDNTAVSTQGGGYIGVSNFETDGTSACDGVDDAGGSNGGGCFTVRGVISLPVPLLACGNTTGKGWDASGRDGCTVP